MPDEFGYITPDEVREIETSHRVALHNAFMDIINDFQEFLKDGPNWKCECGEPWSGSDAKWRWTGEVWQHYHINVGHVDTKRTEP